MKSNEERKPIITRFKFTTRDFYTASSSKVEMASKSLLLTELGAIPSLPLNFRLLRASTAQTAFHVRCRSADAEPALARGTPTRQDHRTHQAGEAL